MKFYPLIFFSAFLLILLQCAPKTVPLSVEETYKEDLSSTIPEVEAYVSPYQNEFKPVDKTFIQPDLDITMELDSLLDSLAIVSKSVPYFQYTILIHNGSSRNEAEEARRNVFRVLPDAKPQMQFISPSYRVKLGKYFNKIDAYQVLVKLKHQFPNAVIVPERVYFD